MSNHLKKSCSTKEDVFSMATDDLAEYILSNASEEARNSFNLAMEDLISREAVKTMEGQIYMLTRRFIVANKNRRAKSQSLLNLSHYFEDINGVVFSGVCDSPKESATTELILFKTTSVKLFDQKWAYDGTTVEKIASQWRQDHLNKVRETQAVNAKRREELDALLLKIEVGCVFGVYMVNEGKSPIAVGPPQDFYEVIEVVSEHSVIVRKIRANFLSNDLLKRAPVLNDFIGEPMVKRLAMAAFCDEDGLRYNYLRFDAGSTNKHGYLSELDGGEYSIYRLGSGTQDRPT